MATPRSRARSSLVAHVYGSSGNVNITYAPTEFRFVNYQKVEDEVHHGWHGKLSPLADAGGDFHSLRFEVDPGFMSVDYKQDASRGGRFYNGPFTAYTNIRDASTPSGQAAWELGNPGDLTTYGATAMSRCAPTNPHASLANMVGELRRDGLPAITGMEIWRKRWSAKRREYLRGDLKYTPDEFLNIEFGIKPLYNDLLKLRTAMLRGQEIMKQYRRDASRVVRRRYAFPSDLSSTGPTDMGMPYPSPGLDLYYWDHGGKTTKTKLVTVDRWYSGAFTFADMMPKSAFGDVTNYLRQANHLLGILPTPEVLWNLTPWTWALDWFTNAGDVVNNASMMATEGLVQVYGYMMERTTVEVVYSHTGSQLLKGPGVNVTQTLKATRKRRVHASPFGFGLTDSALTPKQWAILAAVGLTQSGRYAAK